MSLYTTDNANLIAMFAHEDTSFHDCAVAYERELSRSLELWRDNERARTAGNFDGLREIAAVHQHEITTVLKSIMLIRWPEAATEWIKGL